MTETCDMGLLVQADCDGELDAGQAASLAAHRESCTFCQATYAQLHATRELLRDGLTYHRASPALRRKIADRLAEAASDGEGASRSEKRHVARWWHVGASFGVGAALAASLTLALLPFAGQQNLLDEVVADHIRSLQPGNDGGVVSTDQHTVKPWFDGKLDFAPPVKDLAAQGFPLAAGRLDYLNGRPIAALVYHRAKHSINLLIWPEPGASLSAPTVSEHNGYNVIHWRQNGMTLWAVSDLERSQLEDFVRLFSATP